MRLAIPLPWYSKEVYDICRDDYRGGWRLLIIRVVCGRNPSYVFYGGPGFSLGLAVMFCIGTRFTRESVAFPSFAKAHMTKRWYQMLWEHLHR